MSERDELADLYADILFRRHGIETSQSKDVADELIAAGYRKPRTVTTAPELDALPVGSVVLGDKPWIKTGPDHYEDGGIGFETAASLSISRRGQGVLVLPEGSAS